MNWDIADPEGELFQYDVEVIAQPPRPWCFVLTKLDEPRSGESYQVRELRPGQWECACADYKYRGFRKRQAEGCKHLEKVWSYLAGEELLEGPDPVAADQPVAPVEETPIVNRIASNEITPYKESDARSLDDMRSQVQLIQQVMHEVMKPGEHYGIIPGTSRMVDGKETAKPTLLKPGAEKLCCLFRLAPKFTIERLQDGDHREIISTCTLRHIPSGDDFGEGMGSCSTREAKYAWRKVTRTCPQCGKSTIIKGKAEWGGGWLCWIKEGKSDGCGAKFPDGDQAIESQATGRTPNMDLPDSYNTVLKIANKRSLVAAVLVSTAASDIFTQDLEDAPEPEPPVPAQPSAQPSAATAKPRGQPRPTTPPDQPAPTRRRPAPATPQLPRTPNGLQRFATDKEAELVKAGICEEGQLRERLCAWANVQAVSGIPTEKVADAIKEMDAIILGLLDGVDGRGGAIDREIERTGNPDYSTICAAAGGVADFDHLTLEEAGRLYDHLRTLADAPA